MRVAIVAEYYPRSRDPISGIWAHRQALAARAAGAEVRVLALERPVPTAASLRDAVDGRPLELARSLRAAASQPRHERRDGIDVELVRFLSPGRERSYGSWHRQVRRPLAAALDRLDRSWGVDLVHAHYAAPAGAAARAWCSARRRPLAVSVHGGDILAPTLSSPATRALIGDALRRANVVLCNSEATLRAAARLAGSGAHMRVVHLGAAPCEPAPKHAQPTIVTLAHVIPRKRHVDVLEALELLPSVRWLVIGDGPALPELRRLAAGSERFTFAGRLPPEQALSALARAHLMVMPSIDEAFGVAYVEALACGVPAIGCAGVGGPEEIAAMGGGMVLVPPRDPPALARAIERALADRSLPDAARATASTHFTWEACGESTLRAYRDALR
ncbi:MAG: hypothetical protein NVSMB25_03230 [Thermoleophilaceae bacterium]